jgi:hypothetical protein
MWPAQARAPRLLLPAFAAVFLGATTVTRGRFNAWGACIAVYFLATGITGLQLLGAESFVQQLSYGGALVIAGPWLNWPAAARHAAEVLPTDAKADAAVADCHNDLLLGVLHKEVRVFETAEGSKEFVLEEPIVADFGLVRAWKGNRHGNLVFRRSARNFNPLAAMCGRVTIAEVEHLVEPGEIDADDAQTRCVRAASGAADQGAGRGQAVEKRTMRSRTGG